MSRHTPHRFLPIIAVLGAWLTASLAAAQSAAPAPATAPDAAAEALAARKDREEQLKTMPAVHVKSLRDVVQFAIENDDVVLRTSVAPTDMAAIVADGRPTLISVSAERGEGAGGNEPTYQPPLFAVMRHEYVPPDGVAITQINAIAPRISISKSAEGAGFFRNVDFIQSDEFLEEGDERVRFYVQEHRNDEVIVDLKLAAANVTELRRKYPAETMRYLEPIFRDFGQSAVLFQVNSRAAWQVLGGTYAPPKEVAKQVDALLVRLDADDAKERAAALKDLEALGQQAALVLMKRDRAGLSEEQQSRVETFLGPYKPLTDAEAAKMGSDTEFLLTALSAEDVELTTRALERLKAVAKQPIAFDVKSTGNARADAIAKLRAQLIPAATQPATTQSTKPPAVEAP
jgi:hypothetical protein